MHGEDLSNSDQFFRALIEHNPDAVLLLDRDGIITYASPAAPTVTGYTPCELVGKKSCALLHPQDQVKIQEQLTALVNHERERCTIEARWCNKDGTWRWIEMTITNLLDQAPVNALLCSARHLHQRSQLPMLEEAAQHLLNAERTFRSLVESNIVGLMVTDQEGRMYEVNQRLVEMMGYSQEELLSGKMRVKDLLLSGYQAARTRAWRMLIAHGASLPEEKVYRRKDGTTFHTLVAATTINQERTRALVMLLDITDRWWAERRKEEFLGMVNHELRTPLTIIQGFLELGLLCVERLSNVPSVGMTELLNQLQTMLEQAKRQAELETRLVAHLLDMSRAERQQFEVTLRVCNLVTIVEQVVATQQSLYSDRPIKIQLPEQALVPVAVDADRIEQVLTNYLTNACKHSAPGQEVLVNLSVEGLAARVSVRDQGPGIPLEEQQRVWDLGYQMECAKQQGANGGLGLGLYIARSIMAQHQGQVGVESLPGKGATFWFLLPLSDEPIMPDDADQGSAMSAQAFS